MLFTIVFLIVILQRLIELIVAKNNESWMRSKGAYEVGASHYPYMVAMHVAFFIALLVEVDIFSRPVSPLWSVLLTLFIIAQCLRLWCLSSLGKFWNTKIIILPNANVVAKGPYRFLRHPNYVIVTAEILILPLLFSAYFTAIVFTLLNIWMLSVRIPLEEKALKDATDYRDQFSLK